MKQPSAEVIPFTRAADDAMEIWVCNCGSEDFYLIKGGDIECKKCGVTFHSIRTFHP